MAKITDCRVCELRKKRIKKDHTVARQVTVFEKNQKVHSVIEKMKEKIDSSVGRYIHSMRMGIVEPVFGNLRSNLGLRAFTLRGRTKVNIQWKLYAMVHNIGKIFRYGMAST